MHIVTALAAILLRCFRPSRGLHAAPLVLTRELRAEARRRRSSRVRRYAADLGTVANAPVSPVPVPRPAPDDTPCETLPPDEPSEAFVRGYYLAHETRHRRVARQPLVEDLPGLGAVA